MNKKAILMKKYMYLVRRMPNDEIRLDKDGHVLNMNKLSRSTREWLR